MITYESAMANITSAYDKGDMDAVKSIFNTVIQDRGHGKVDNLKK